MTLWKCLRHERPPPNERGLWRSVGTHEPSTHYRLDEPPTGTKHSFPPLSVCPLCSLLPLHGQIAWKPFPTPERAVNDQRSRDNLQLQH